MNSLKKLKDMLMALKEKGAEEIVEGALELLAEPLGYKIAPFDPKNKDSENDIFAEFLSKVDELAFIFMEHPNKKQFNDKVIG